MSVSAAGDGPTVRLDVQSVAPKDRFPLIMGAYDGLGPAESLELTVDHDPRCMYYALKATRAEDGFSFEYLEEGPEVWRVRVERGASGETEPPSP